MQLTSFDQKFKEQHEDLESIFDGEIKNAKGELKSWVMNEREPEIHARVEANRRGSCQATAAHRGPRTLRSNAANVAY